MTIPIQKIRAGQGLAGRGAPGLTGASLVKTRGRGRPRR